MRSLLTRGPVVVLACGALGIGIGLGLSLGQRWTGSTERVPVVFAAPPYAGDGPDFASIARRATPAVVNISALQVVRRERSVYLYDPFFNFFGGDLPFRVPMEQRRTSLGSGVLVGGDGLIVTNHHVIKKARRIVITTADRKRHEGRLLGSDPATDVAVVQIEGHDFPTLAWGDSGASSAGEYVLAIGNPFQLNQTVTMGIISATGRSNVGIVDYEDFIQTDAAINPGNSGGALVNTRGELIGINSAIYSETGGYQGIGFAVPSNLARRVSEEIVAHGRVRRGWVGITRIRELDEGMARTLGVAPGRGAVIWELLRGSPAARAGVEPGDVVRSVNGVAVDDAGHLRNLIADATVGGVLVLSIEREGRRLELRVPVEERRGGD